MSKVFIEVGFFIVKNAIGPEYNTQKLRVDTIVEGSMSNDEDWYHKFCYNVGECLDNGIIRIDFNSLNNVKEYIDNEIISKGHNSLNIIDWIHWGCLWGQSQLMLI